MKRLAGLLGLVLLGACVLFAGQVSVGASALPTPQRLGDELRALAPLTLKAVRVVDLKQEGTRARVVLSREFLSLSESSLLVEQTVHRLSLLLHPIADVDVFVDTPFGPMPLSDLLPLPLVPDDFSPPPPRATPALAGEAGQSHFPLVGPLTGKRIAVSPGHGWYWVQNLGGWYTQRPLVHGMIEDMGNWRMASHVIRALEQTGASVFSCRERDRNTLEYIVDDDNSPHYSDGAGWSSSSYTGYAGGTYRFRSTVTSPTGVVPARWRPPFARDADYAVYVFYRAGSNRAPDARYVVRHAGGSNVVRLDQTINDRRWVYIGTYRFTTGDSSQGVELWPDSATSGVVIADAVKFGGGMGSIRRNNAASGKPRWEEAARYWVEYVGAPTWAYNSHLADDTGDVTTRPLYTNWQGADLFLSLHTNAFNGEARGTETYMYNGTVPAGTQNWRNLVHNRMVHAIRTEWVSNWADRGVKSGNYGEVRELDGIPGCLTEVAFHDNAYDASYLKRPPFRATVARAVAKAALEFFNPATPMFPLPVRNIRVIPPRPGVLRLMWEPTADPSFPDAAPSSYRIYLTRGLAGHDAGSVTTTNTYWETSDWEPGEILTFRVAARNAGGESLKSEPVVARVWPNRFPQVLIVNGFTRLDRSIQEEDNTRDYNLIHARALADSGAYSFVSASSEAVAARLIDLPLFRMVDWLAGEQARLSEEVARFTALSVTERELLGEFLDGGGNLMISGSEIGWDAFGSPHGNQAYRDFHENVLRASYVADDANTYAFTGVTGDWFEGLSGTFDDGTQGTYDVDWPEVIAARAGSRACLRYPDNRAMGVCYDGGVGMLLYMGVPFETLVGENLRAEFMRRVTARMLPAPTEPDGDVDGDDPADGDTDGDVDGDGPHPEDGDEDWELDLDREAPPDGDIEQVEFELDVDGDDKPDGDVPDGDVPDGDTPDGDTPDGDTPDGDTPDGDRPDGDTADGDRPDGDRPDGDLPGDGDIPQPDGDDPSCLPGYTQQGGMCIKEESSGGGGCSSTSGGGGLAVFLLGLLLLGLRRRVPGLAPQ